MNQHRADTPQPTKPSACSGTSIPKTARGDFKDTAIRTANTLFNPFEHDKILKPSDPNPGRTALHHAGGLALGYGGLALVIRKIQKYQQSQLESKETDELKSYVQAQYPTLSIDPDTDDAAEEEKIRSLGTTKEAGSDAWRMFDPARRRAVQTISGNQDPAHLALAVTAAIAGGTSGWKLAEYIRDRERKGILTERISESENQIDSLLHSEYKRTRGLVDAPDPQGLPKLAAGERITPQQFRDNNPQASRAVATGERRTPSVIKAIMRPKGFVQAAENLWWLWAAGAFALSYKAMKNYSDKNDPNRARMKQLKEVGKDRAKVRTAPVLMDESNLEGLTHAKPKPARKSSSSVAVAPNQVAAAPTPVDKSDPYADLLRT